MIDKVTSMDGVIECQEKTDMAVAIPAAPEAPTLGSIIELICRDARRDSMQFALRSDVGLDGE